MNATMSKKLRFSDAVYAMQTTPKTLRNWLQRSLVALDTERPPGDAGWIEYSFVDIGVLVLTKLFVDFGVSVPVANAMAIRVTFMHPTPFMRHPENMPLNAWVATWAGRRLLAYPEASEPNGWALDSITLREKPDPQILAYISIDVETLLRGAFTRALESNSEGGDE
jgi:hypothetical protein